MAVTRSVRLTSSPTVKASRERRKASEIPVPDQRMYGVFGPSYAGYLASTAGAQGPTDSAALAALNAGALRNNAQREARDYAAMLGRAQDMQATAGRDAIYGDLMQDVADRGTDWAKLGMLGVEGIEVDEQGRPYITYDPTHQQVGNANVLNTDQAERFGTYATAVDTLRKSGVEIPDSYLGELFTPPTQVEPVPITSGTAPLTPSDATDRYEADEGLTAEQRMLLGADEGDDESDYADYEIQYSRSQKPIGIKYKGTPEQVARTQAKLREMGIDPATGVTLGEPKLNPKADEQGGGSSATPAAPRNKTTQRIEVVPSEGFFAPDKITSKKGMRKHPILGVNRMHGGDE